MISVIVAILFGLKHLLGYCVTRFLKAIVSVIFFDAARSTYKFSKESLTT